MTDIHTVNSCYSSLSRSGKSLNKAFVNSLTFKDRVQRNSSKWLALRGLYREGFPGGASRQESAGQCGRLKRCGFDPWVGKISWRRKQQLVPVFLPGKSQGQRCLAATVHGVAKSQTQLSTHTHRGRLRMFIAAKDWTQLKYLLVHKWST